jgi:hypothetical protein
VGPVAVGSCLVLSNPLLTPFFRTQIPSVGEIRTLTDDYDGTFLGFYVVSFVQNLGGNSVTPSDVPETAQKIFFLIGISSNQEFR